MFWAVKGICLGYKVPDTVAIFLSLPDVPQSDNVFAGMDLMCKTVTQQVYVIGQT